MTPPQTSKTPLHSSFRMRSAEEGLRVELELVLPAGPARLSASPRGVSVESVPPVLSASELRRLSEGLDLARLQHLRLAAGEPPLPLDAIETGPTCLLAPGALLCRACGALTGEEFDLLNLFCGSCGTFHRRLAASGLAPA